MRLFIAIPFDPPVLDALTSAQTSLKARGVRGGFTVRQNLHMTVAFLGEVRDPRPVIATFERIPLPRSAMRFERTELFRDTLVCTFCVDPSLRQYAQSLRIELEKAGLPFDRKPFRPHVTLARRTAIAGDRPDVPANEALRSIEIALNRVCLMRTDFIDGRPKYTCLHTCGAVERDADR